MERTDVQSDRASRQRSRRGHGDQLRAEVLDAVNRLLAEWGSDEKLTMRAVAKEVGVSAPSIYLHFTDKAELVWAALSDKYEQLAERMRAAEEAVGADEPRKRLQALAHAYCRFALDNPGHYRLMYEVRQPAADPAKIGLHPSRLVSRRFRRAIAACADAGHALALPRHQAAHTLWTGLHGIVSLQHSLSLEASADMVAGLVEGLMDVLVSPQPQERPEMPPTTDVDRLIARTVADDVV
jgi:AcrR family transcriptional regulator